MTTTLLVKDYLARGGTITKPRPRGQRRNRKHPLTYHDMSITVTGSQHDKIKVPVERSRIAEAETWLINRKVPFRTSKTIYGGCYQVYFAKVSDAVLFKLSWPIV